MVKYRAGWFRRFVQRHTKPIAYQTAVDWKQKLSLLYMFIAWNAFGGVCYAVYKGQGDWAKYYGLKSEEELKLSPAQSFAKILDIKNAKVITMSGFRKTGEFEINNEDENDKQ